MFEGSAPELDPGNVSSSVNFQCDVCKTTFSQRHLYNRHIKKHTRPYICDINDCGAKFSLRQDLVRHQHSVHQTITGEEKFYCYVSGCKYSHGGVKFFTRKDHLVRHMRSHPETPTYQASKTSEQLSDSLLGEADVRGNPQTLRDFAPSYTPWTVPFERNPSFVGREEYLDRLHKILYETENVHTAALCGLGGIGKTQIALEFAYRSRERYPERSVFWVSVTNIDSFQQAYEEIGCQLQIPDSEKKEGDIKQLVQHHLSQEKNGPWLLIFDNADDSDMWFNSGNNTTDSEILIDYIPRGRNGSILFTTRNRKLAVKLAQQNIIEVERMGEMSTANLLRKIIINQNILEDEYAMRQLMWQFEFLPLAIVQAAAYINENDISLSEYLSLFNDQENESVFELLSEDFLDERRYRGAKNTVMTSFLVSLEQIRLHHPLAADYLAFMSCIDPESIPASLLPPAESKKRAIDALGTLRAYSFIEKQLSDQCLSVHRLVYLATRNWLKDQGLLEYWTERVMNRLNEVMPTDDYSNPNSWKVYLPHVHRVIMSNGFHQTAAINLQLLEKFGLCLLSDQRYDEAEKVFRVLVEETKSRLGPDNPTTLANMSNLASAWGGVGRLREAAQLEMQVLQTREMVLGLEHPSTLSSMSSLALKYLSQGQLKEAEELEKRAADMRRKVLGIGHPSTITSISNLAMIYLKQGRLSEAEELGKQAIEMRGDVLGLEHPSTLASLNNLALTYLSQGRLKEVAEVEKHVAAIKVAPGPPFKGRNRTTGQPYRDPASTPSSGRGDVLATPSSSEMMVLSQDVMEPKRKQLERLSDESIHNESPEEKVQRLESQIREARENSDKLWNDLNESGQRIIQLQNQKNESWGTLRQAISDNEEFAGRQNQLANTQNAQNSMHGEVQMLKEQLANAYALTRDLRAELEGLTRELEEALVREQGLRAENYELRKHNQRLLERSTI